MEDYKNKIKLGAFIIGGIILFLSALLYLGKENNIFTKTITIAAIFKNVEGLNSGDNVWLSGVKIGTIKEVVIVAEGKVVVSMALKERQNQFITKDATASVGSDGLVGSKIVVIRPGRSKDIVNDMDTINSLSPTDTQELFDVAKDVGVNFEGLTSDLKKIMAKIEKGEGVLGELVNDGEISKDVRASIRSLRTTTQNSADATAQMKVVLASVQKGDGLLPHLLNDSTSTDAFKTALADLAAMSQQAKTIAENIQQLTLELNKDNSLLNVLASDSIAAKKLKETVESAASAAAKLDENMTAMQSNFLLRGYFRKKEKEENRK